ncbi:hypothetical protein [Streptomyces sp. VRA16 Mangrove soil]|uniref:hypothetical protein n=1 Tax=Streptomyces sp. VRA16 Mangrove soil TaxID=2817434 RepID=UPI001A9E1285|nr:hypothetical protein [Streptomyces sp. VRA16 Mangrove soil]MBO1329989.1 hypothetical protein [Streptomyces sp. VRA16 Mangrove soil]
MIHHTMLVSFENSLPDADLDQFLQDIEKAMRDSGQLRTFSARRHIPVPGEEEIPALIATAVLQFGVADRDALAAAFAAPGAEEVIHRWQARHPYKVAWVNHTPLD